MALKKPAVASSHPVHTCSWNKIRDKNCIVGVGLRTLLPMHNSILNSFVLVILGIEAEDWNSKFRQTSVLRYTERGACTDSSNPNTRHLVKLNPYPLDFKLLEPEFYI